eukprot:m.183135 g.183135  ORF g.183135 m.183135 type:complete len:61 (+) comp39302_c0_seq4:129-311(+)
MLLLLLQRTEEEEDMQSRSFAKLKPADSLTAQPGNRQEASVRMKVFIVANFMERLLCAQA